MKVLQPLSESESADDGKDKKATEASSDSGVAESLETVVKIAKKVSDATKPPVTEEETESKTPEEDAQPEAEEPTGTPFPDEPADEGADTPFDDDKTGEAIDEIVAKEGDDVLAAQDAAAGKGKVKAKPKGSHWWRRKWLRWTLALMLLGGIGAAAAVPTARYWVLNAAGVRSSASVVVTDGTTELPLKGVRVALDGVAPADTDAKGTATLKGLKLGPHTLTITQVGFAEVSRRVVIGWGSNPLGTTKLRAVGIQYVIQVTDYLSDKPVVGATAVSGDATAVSDKNGKITLTLASTVVAKDGVTVTANGYRTESLTLNADPTQPTKAALVLARKVVFVAKDSGRYDVYKSDIDGQNREVLLAGTGNETSNIALVMSPDAKRAALVSTRDGKSSGGSLLSSLVLIDVDKGNTLTIAEAPQIRLIDWLGARLIFETVTSDTSAANRHTVVGYNYADNSRVQLAAANKLYAAFSAQGAIYYAVGEDAGDGSVLTGLYKINPDGSNKARTFEQEVWSVLRSDYNTLYLQLADGTWYTYSIPNGASKLGTPPSLISRQFLDNPDRTQSAWIASGALLSYNVASGKDTTIATPTSPVQPVQWLGVNALVYRISTSGETADYASSTVGGTPHKIANVAATYGFSE